MHIRHPSRRRVRRAVAAALAASTALAGGAFAQTLTEPSTGIQFNEQASAGGESFQCLGTGVRKVLGVKAYAVTYCLEAGRERAALDRAKSSGQGGSGKGGEGGQSEAFFESLASNSADKLVVMKAARNLSRTQLADAFRDSLSKILPESSVNALVDAIPSGIDKGETARLYTTDGQSLVIDIAGKKNTLKDPEAAQKLWLVWLGPDSVSPSLKESIAQRAG